MQRKSKCSQNSHISCSQVSALIASARSLRKGRCRGPQVGKRPSSDRPGQQCHPGSEGKGQPPAQDRQCVALKLPEAAGKSLFGVSFIDATNGWIVGEQGLCLRTSDAGRNWTLLKPDSQATLRAVQFHADGTGLACGDGDPTAPRPGGRGSHMVSSRPILAATLLRTTDGGTTWTYAWLPTNFEAPALAASPQSVWVGTIASKTHPDGDLWLIDAEFKLHQVRAYRAILALAVLGDNRWLAAGCAGFGGLLADSHLPFVYARPLPHPAEQGRRAQLGAGERERGKRLAARPGRA